MNTERLQKIRARCVELLEIATKRTQGNWRLDQGGDKPNKYPGVQSSNRDSVVAPYYNYEGGGVGEYDDAVFIASCAGPAEAGWRSTIAAIDLCANIRRQYAEQSNQLLYAFVEENEAEIITAWEGVEI